MRRRAGQKGQSEEKKADKGKGEGTGGGKNRWGYSPPSSTAGDETSKGGDGRRLAPSHTTPHRAASRAMPSGRG